ncbi:hypothetical protein GcC1_185039 [Golovinomyces cichoracearum]|uniref:Uncharacterized protein n=1 Tax=Golovinomyces cichoracearum TaxID=62708 RepID=A0A420HKP0_9PEZI|nr:hypothetical protein GcC1_185039 [Golovinomyces cichoracearum]
MKSPEIDIENRPPDNSSAVDPIESYTEDDFPQVLSRRNEAQHNELNKSIYCIEPKIYLTSNSSQPKLYENMK